MNPEWAVYPGIYNGELRVSYSPYISSIRLPYSLDKQYNKTDILELCHSLEQTLNRIEVFR